MMASGDACCVAGNLSPGVYSPVVLLVIDDAADMVECMRCLGVGLL